MLFGMFMLLIYWFTSIIYFFYTTKYYGRKSNIHTQIYWSGFNYYILNLSLYWYKVNSLLVVFFIFVLYPIDKVFVNLQC